MNDSPPALRMQGVAKAYGHSDRSVPVLAGVDLQVRRGEAVALIGRSGSGKTTLINVICGLLPVDHGEVSIGGTPLDNTDADQRARVRRRRIGIVFQQFNLIPTLTALENLEFPLALAGCRHKPDLESLLERLDLDHLAHRFPPQMSGGEQQRLAVLRAVVHEPDLVLADEPTANLDLENAGAVMALLAEQTRERGAALVLVTHSSDLTVAIDRVLRIEQRTLSQVR